ncbi:hypothetical protein DCO17_06625 [Polynucleobacter tropicus]|uniref:Uncharacterized protein n=1 Tax=Polynucleobacter tropicus TaxID=1743174 RepID=A0A6M9PQZ5_9BURK|nr:hypothetical protein [Polynucleobacter tropicus]QKM64930.1 hypothetical protein DCO17_06625 [Polynucleobacter tropicus]
MPESLQPLRSIKPLRVKKTLDDLLGEGQVKTGKAVLDEKAQKAKEEELFLAAALEELHMRQFATKRRAR